MADDKDFTGQDEILANEAESIAIETDAAQSEAAKQTLPAAIKFGIPALLGVAVLVVVGAYSFIHKPSQAKVDPLPTPAAVINDIAIQTAPPSLPAPREPDLVDRAVLDRLVGQIESLDRRITESLSRFESQRDALVQQGGSIQEVKAALANNEA